MTSWRLESPLQASASRSETGPARPRVDQELVYVPEPQAHKLAHLRGKRTALAGGVQTLNT